MFEYLDPALSYEAPGWQVLYMTNLMLPGLAPGLRPLRTYRRMGRDPLSRIPSRANP